MGVRIATSQECYTVTEEPEVEKLCSLWFSTCMYLHVLEAVDEAPLLKRVQLLPPALMRELLSCRGSAVVAGCRGAPG